MLPSRQELKGLILDQTPLNFCRSHLFDQNTHIFENAEECGTLGTYHEFKCVIANKLGTSPANIAIVGSGKFGFSMNPGKKELLKKITLQSDLDIVIACPQTFEKIWHQLRKAHYSGQTQVYDEHAKNLFSRFLVVADKMEYSSTHMKETLTLLAEMKKEVSVTCRIKRDINYRIYANWLDVEAYHQYGIKVLRGFLNGPRGECI